MNIRLGIIGLALPLCLHGCGGIDLLKPDTVVEPAPLVNVEAPIQIDQRWAASVGGGWGNESKGIQPMLQEGRLYLASPGGRIVALDAVTGETLMRIDGEDITAGPGVGAGLLLAGTREGKVLAYSARTGELLWRESLSGEILAPPRVAVGKVLVRTLDGKLFALSVENGRILWVYSDSVPPLSLYGTSAPLPYQDSIAIAGFDSGRLVSIDIDSGLPTWEIEVASPSGSTELERMIDIDAELKIAGNFLLSSGYQSRLVMVDILTGQVAWGYNVSTFNSAGFAADAGESGQVYVADEKGRVVALNATTGEPVWEHELLLNRRLSAPVAYREYVVCPDSEGYLHWFHQLDGRPAGRTRTTAHQYATALVHEDLLIFHARGKVTAYSTE